MMRLADSPRYQHRQDDSEADGPPRMTLVLMNHQARTAQVADVVVVGAMAREQDPTDVRLGLGESNLFDGTTEHAYKREAGSSSSEIAGRSHPLRRYSSGRSLPPLKLPRFGRMPVIWISMEQQT